MANHRDIVKANAIEVRTISIESARALPGFLGKIVPVQLSEYGWYAHNTPNGIIYYELQA